MVKADVMEKIGSMHADIKNLCKTVDGMRESMDNRFSNLEVLGCNWGQKSTREVKGVIKEKEVTDRIYKAKWAGIIIGASGFAGLIGGLVSILIKMVGIL